MPSSDPRRSRHGRHRAPRPRRSGVLATALVLASLLIIGVFVRTAVAKSPHEAARSASASSSPTAMASPSAVPSPSVPSPPVPSPPVPSPSSRASAAPRPVAVPVLGPGTFGYAAGEGNVLGTAGKLLRFRVAVENGMGQDPAEFAATVDRVLGDPRSWIASGTLRLRRVPARASADFTIFLATAGTSQRLCRAAGLDTRGYTSCRLSGKVIINVARWLGSVPDYGAPLAVYQAYAINHEVGHELGHGHEACPGRGRPAPVMQQQTFGLRGCVANAWPYLAGRRYAGPRA